MNAEGLKKIRRLGANAQSRKRITTPFMRCQNEDVCVEKYRSALLQRYPVGLLENVEVQALLMSWNKPAPIRSFMQSEFISVPWLDAEL